MKRLLLLFAPAILLASCHIEIQINPPAPSGHHDEEPISSPTSSKASDSQSEESESPIPSQSTPAESSEDTPAEPLTLTYADFPFMDSGQYPASPTGNWRYSNVGGNSGKFGSEQYIQFKANSSYLENIEAIGPYNQVVITYFDNYVSYDDSHKNPEFTVSVANEVATPSTKGQTETSSHENQTILIDTYTFENKQFYFHIENEGGFAGYVYQITFQVA